MQCVARLVAYNFARFPANDIKVRQVAETEPVARDNKMIFTLKTGDQTFVAPYSTDVHSTVLENSVQRMMERHRLCLLAFY